MKTAHRLWDALFRKALEKSGLLSLCPILPTPLLFFPIPRPAALLPPQPCIFQCLGNELRGSAAWHQSTQVSRLRGILVSLAPIPFFLLTPFLNPGWTFRLHSPYSEQDTLCYSATGTLGQLHDDPSFSLHIPICCLLQERRPGNRSSDVEEETRARVLSLPRPEAEFMHAPKFVLGQWLGRQSNTHMARPILFSRPKLARP